MNESRSVAVPCALQVRKGGYAVLGTHRDRVVGLVFYGGTSPRVQWNTDADKHHSYDDRAQGPPTQAHGVAQSHDNDRELLATSRICGESQVVTNAELRANEQGEADDEPSGVTILSACADGTVTAWEPMDAMGEKYRMRQPDSEISSVLVLSLSGGHAMVTGERSYSRKWPLAAGDSGPHCGGSRTLACLSWWSRAKKVGISVQCVHVHTGALGGNRLSKYAIDFRS